MAKQFDEDLAALKEQVKVDQEPYSLGHKENVIRIEYLLECLVSRGEKVGGISDFLRKAADSVNGQMEE